MTVVVARRDPRWNDAAWRTDTLLAAIADHQLTTAEIAEIVGRSEFTVRQWRSGRAFPVPVHALRLLMLELAFGGRDGLA